MELNLDRNMVERVIELADACYPNTASTSEVEFPDIFAAGRDEILNPPKEYRELHEYIAGLPPLDQGQLTVLMLIGRGDLEPEDLANREIVERYDQGTPGYLADKMYLAEYLRNGLAKIQAK